MNNIWILFSCLLYSIDGRITRPRICRNCTGKIHKKQDLELTKLPLIIDKTQICIKANYEYFIIIKSGSFSRRNFTRSTWAKEMKEHFHIPILYAIGTPKNSSIQQDLFAEDEQFHDLLQFNFLENYYNLTIKTTSVLVWYDRHCSKNSKYLFYVDDDLLIHTEKFTIYMMQMNYSDAMEGWFEKAGKILRTGVGGVTKEDFPIDITPDYLWGAAVLYPSNIVSNLLIKFIFNTTLPIFFRDDVFINAFIAEEAGIKRQQMKGLVLYDPTEDSLKDNMIVIDFTNEEHRYRAWNCYKYNKQCNRNLLLTLFKFFSVLSLFGIIILSCCKMIKAMKCYKPLIYQLDAIYYEMKTICEQNLSVFTIIMRKFCPTIKCRRVKFTIYLILHSKRNYIRLGFFVIILIVFYHFLLNK